ncbi:TPA: ATP-dependent helicase [Candidatus Latescibacteria bacterium]|nr:ATP-dependent helicase [Candidatus Latescibacterota bacterium]
MDFSRFLKQMRNGYEYDGQIAHIEEIPEREAVFGSIEQSLNPDIVAGLEAQGITQLYQHQADAVSAAFKGEHTVIVTSTASGKTLCYQIPTFEHLLEHPDSTALYLFPTKALAQDQARGLARLGEDREALRTVSGTYDGDTPPDLRRKLREEGQIILTNPDMLHQGILPNHPRWGRFFQQLRYVVIDEVHAYRGIFGSHVANVIRRLTRICNHYGVSPQFICCSATIANPKEHAESLIGQEMTLVDQDGSPRGRRRFMFWNPPFLEGSTVDRRSPNTEARWWLTKLLQQRIQSIAFVRARTTAEVIYRYCQEDLARISPKLANSIRAYRGGYLPSERREIERQLFEGQLLGVVSTNALELGIDIGGLDSALIVGYPGTIASMWQQAGRAGRKAEESLVVYIAQNAPIDQFLMRTPGYFFCQSPEHATIDPQNPHISVGHLRCALRELPVAPQEGEVFGEFTGAMLEILEEEGQAKELDGKWFYAKSGYPAAEVSLRNMGDKTYTIIEDTENGPNVIGTLDETSAFFQLHTHAVYMHNAQTYFVDKLDVDRKTANVSPKGLDYYTHAVDETTIRINDKESELRWRVSDTCFGEVSVSTLVMMFKKVKFEDRDSIGWENLDLPEINLDTTSCWVIPPREALRLCRTHGRVPTEGMKGVANVMAEVAPLFAMCDPADIGTTIDSGNNGRSTVFLYDRYPGGIGFAEKIYEMMEEVMKACWMVVSECDCEDGCPSCVGAPRPPESGEDGTKDTIPDKEAALILLHALLEKEQYVPVRPRPIYTPVPIENGVATNGEPVEPIPVKPMSANVEAKIRRRVRGFRK